MESRKFVRLHPVRFRDLEAQETYRKFNVIDLQVRHKSADVRGDTWTPLNPDDVSQVAHVTTKRGWAERNALVLPLTRSLEDLVCLERDRVCSLGVTRIVGAAKYYAEPCATEWSDEQLQAMRRDRLFGEAARAPLQKVPWDFKCRFRCQGENCKGHNMRVLDWEMFALYLKVGIWKKRMSPEAARDMVLMHYNSRLNTDTRNLHFLVGTSREHRTFMIIGVYAPPL